MANQKQGADIGSAIHSVFTLAQASNAIRISEHFRLVTPNVRRAVGGTVNQRHLKRNRKFVDSPQERGGFELLVPPSIKPRSGAPYGFRVRLHQLGEPPIPGGTGSSNPSPSSGESDELEGRSKYFARYAGYNAERLAPAAVFLRAECIPPKLRRIGCAVRAVESRHSMRW